MYDKAFEPKIVFISKLRGL